MEDTQKGASFFADKSNSLGVSILVSAIIVSGTLIYVLGPGAGDSGTAPLGPTAGIEGDGSVGEPSTAPVVGGAPMLGDPNAPVTIVEYSDFECPFCARFFSESLTSLEEEYVAVGKVNFVYKDFPLTSIHSQAQKAAESARCVREQLGDEGFWAMHDILFERQELFGVAGFKQWARELGADGAGFDSCLDSGRYASAVMDDFNEGSSLGVSGTPTFFINGTRVVGAVPYEQIAAVIETELQKAD